MSLARASNHLRTTASVLVLALSIGLAGTSDARASSTFETMTVNGQTVYYNVGITDEEFAAAHQKLMRDRDTGRISAQDYNMGMDALSTAMTARQQHESQKRLDKQAEDQARLTNETEAALQKVRDKAKDLGLNFGQTDTIVRQAHEEIRDQMSYANEKKLPYTFPFTTPKTMAHLASPALSQDKNVQDYNRLMNSLAANGVDSTWSLSPLRDGETMALRDGYIVKDGGNLHDATGRKIGTVDLNAGKVLDLAGKPVTGTDRIFFDELFREGGTRNGGKNETDPFLASTDALKDDPFFTPAGALSANEKSADYISKMCKLNTKNINEPVKKKTGLTGKEKLERKEKLLEEKKAKNDAKKKTTDPGTIASKDQPSMENWQCKGPPMAGTFSVANKSSWEYKVYVKYCQDMRDWSQNAIDNCGARLNRDNHSVSTTGIYGEMQDPNPKCTGPAPIFRDYVKGGSKYPFNNGTLNPVVSGNTPNNSGAGLPKPPTAGTSGNTNSIGQKVIKISDPGDLDNLPSLAGANPETMDRLRNWVKECAAKSSESMCVMSDATHRYEVRGQTNYTQNDIVRGIRDRFTSDPNLTMDQARKIALMDYGISSETFDKAAENVWSDEEIRRGIRDQYENDPNMTTNQIRQIATDKYGVSLDKVDNAYESVWSDEEIRRGIRDQYENDPNMTANQIRQIATDRYGVSLDKVDNAYESVWSDEEIRRGIRDQYTHDPNMTPEQIRQIATDRYGVAVDKIDNAYESVWSDAEIADAINTYRNSGMSEAEIHNLANEKYGISDTQYNRAKKLNN